ncbi:MAG: glycosyltransferase [Treponema sp.]|nr:glycosyltransferase [Treponema sp.]
MLPLITVVIPVYNREKLLFRCVESVLAQDYTHYEIIIVDDGSSDNSYAVAQDYASRYENIQAITQKNSGVSVARNRGIELSNGEYIIFVDSDDTIDAKMLSTYVHELEIADYDLVVCGFKNIDIEEKKCFYEVPFCNINSIEIFWKSFYSLLKNHILRSPCNKLYKTKIIKENCLVFNPSFQIAEDALFNTEYYKYLKNVSVLTTPLYKVLVHDDTGRLSQKYHTNFINAQSLLYPEYVKLLKLNNSYYGKNKKYLAYEYSNTLWYGMEREYKTNKNLIMPGNIPEEMWELLRLHGKLNLPYRLFYTYLKRKDEKSMTRLIKLPVSLRKIANIPFRLLCKTAYR